MRRRLNLERRPESSAAVHLVLVLVQVAFASLSVEGKLAMSPAVGIDPASLAMARVLGGALVLLPMGLKGKALPSLRDIARLALLSSLGIVLNQVLFLRGLKATSPLSATVLVASIPVFAAAASVLLGSEKLETRTALGLALAVLGVGVLSRFRFPSGGDLLVLLNAMSYGLYLALAKPVILRLGSRTMIAWVFGLGALLLLPVGGVSFARDVPSWSLSAWALVAYIVAVPTIFAYLGNAWALSRAAPSQVAVYIYLQPVFVALLARVQLGMPVEPRLVVAGFFILAGVLVVTARRG